MQFKETIKKINSKYIKIIEKHHWLVLIGYFLITAFLLFHASKIEIRTRFIDLLPDKKVSVQSLKKVVDYYGGEGFLIGVVEWNYAYTDTLKWMDRLKQETQKIHTEMQDIWDHKDQNFEKWLNSKDNRIKLKALVDFYHTISDNVKNQIQTIQNNNKITESKNGKKVLHYSENQTKYLHLFSREMTELAIPRLKKSYEDFIKNPKNLDVVESFLEKLEENVTRFKNYKRVILKKHGGEKDLIRLAEELAVELEKEKDYIKYVEYKFRTNFIKDNLLYFIDVPDLEDIRDRIDKKINYERRKKLISSYLLEQERVSLSFDDIEKKYSKSTKVLKVTSKTDLFEKAPTEYEYYINKEGNRLLLLIKPSKESTDIGFAEKLTDRARAIAKRVLAQKVTGADGGLHSKYPNEISIGYTGRYVKKIEDAKAIKRDLKVITPLAFGMIIIAVFVYFRKFRAVLVVGIPLASGLVWATGIVQLTIGYFNIVTGFLIAILSGLGVDFSVHLFSRYVEEKKRGKTVFEALETVFRTTFLSNLTSTATTAAAFFVLVISQFKGFSQFGYTAGMGMLLLLLGILFAFPSIVVIADKIAPMKINKNLGKKHPDKYRGRRLPGYRWIIWGSLIFTVISMFGVANLKFNANFYDLAADNTMGKKLEKKAEELIKMSLWPVIIYAKDWETMKDTAKYINDLKEKGQLPTLDKIDSLYNYVPEKQSEKKKVMLEIKEKLRDSVLSKLKGEERKKVERLKEIVDANFISLKDVPSELKRQFFGKKEGYFLFYYPHFNLSMSKVSTVRKMVNDIKKVYDKFKDRGIIVASDAMIFDDVLKIITYEGPIIVVLVILAIFVLLWLDFRSLKSVLATLFPLTIGILWIFGWMYLTGWSLNYFNVVMFPVIMGLGIDYGVHLYHRYKEDGKHNIYFIIRTTGMAILIGGLTDVMGFGTLLWAKYKGLATMGQIAIAGIISCVSAGILFMASLFELKKDAQIYGWKNAFLGRTKEEDKKNG